MRIALEILGGLLLLTVFISGAVWYWRQLNARPVDEAAGRVNPSYHPLDEDDHCCDGKCSIKPDVAPINKEIVK